jgi:molybdenum cofactor cytidylyltransferase
VASVSAILLAAGESSRMGRPKALLDWRGVPLVQYQLRALAEACVAETIVVLGHRASEIAPYVRGPGIIKTVINPRYAEGKATSVITGLREVQRKATGVLLLAVDQPRPVSVLRLLLQEHQGRKALIAQPTHQGKRGHPIVFDVGLLPELLAITEEGEGVRQVVRRHRERVLEVPVDWPVVLLDINTEEDYTAARRLF